MNCMRIDPNYDTSKNGKHRKELKTVLRSIYDCLGRYPGYRTVITGLHERGYKCGQQMARELLRTLWLPESFQLNLLKFLIALIPLKSASVGSVQSVKAVEE